MMSWFNASFSLNAPWFLFGYYLLTICLPSNVYSINLIWCPFIRCQASPWTEIFTKKCLHNVPPLKIFRPVLKVKSQIPAIIVWQIGLPIWGWGRGLFVMTILNITQGLGLLCLGEGGAIHSIYTKNGGHKLFSEKCVYGRGAISWEV